jgi:hypothetical protein
MIVVRFVGKADDGRIRVLRVGGIVIRRIGRKQTPIVTTKRRNGRDDDRGTLCKRGRTDEHHALFEQEKSDHIHFTDAGYDQTAITENVRWITARIGELSVGADPESGD